MLRTPVSTVVRHITFLVLALTGVSCDQAPEATLSPDEGISTSVTEAESDSANYNVLSKGVALALSNRDVRMRLLKDMRDSPFPENSLHLQSYLRGQDGQRLLHLAAEMIGKPPSELQSRLAELPTSQIYLPSSLHRANWTGSSPVLVLGSDTHLDDLAQRKISAWLTSGTKTSFGIHAPAPHPLIAITPSKHTFGPNPEAARDSAPTHSRETVAPAGFFPRHESTEDTLSSTTKDRREPGSGNYASVGHYTKHSVSLASTPIRGPALSGAVDEHMPRLNRDSETRTVPSGGGYEPGYGLPSDVTWNNCSSYYGTDDSDDDQLWDHCEYELTRAFAPKIHYDPGENYPGRQTYWAARTVPEGDEVSMFYAYGYYDDNGAYFSHVGDSEWVFLLIRWTNGRWKLVDATYSAHWGSSTDETRTYSYDQLEYPVGYRGAPNVYASGGKHANYNTEANCEDWENFESADCGSGPLTTFFTVHQGRNLGNRSNKLVTCPTEQDNTCDDGHTLDGWECMWNTSGSFDGWHYNFSDDATPYGVSLDHWNDWVLNYHYSYDDPPDDGGGGCDECL